jgi:glycosyltransferase involved in cell wall biosynthesis
MRIAIINHDDFSIWTFRRALIARLVADGHQVDVLCGRGPYIDRILELGVTWVPMEMPRFITPVEDVKWIWRLWRMFRRGRYDLVHLFQNKVIVYGAVTAWLAGVGRICASSTGIGYITNDIPGFKNRIVATITRALYRIAMPRIDKVLFQNEYDRDHLVAAGYVAAPDTVLVRGSGVSLDEYAPDRTDRAAAAKIAGRLGDTQGRVVIAMVARAVLTKGVAEFIEASRLLEARQPGRALCVLWGDVEADNPETLTPEDLRAAEHAGFRWMGWCDTVREALAACDIAALPSYREGTPRSMLEAMAMAKPVVTTRAPGCEALVDEARNGYLVPVQDGSALADALEKLVTDAPQRTAFGIASREKCRAEFSDEIVVSRILSDLYEISSALTQPPAARPVELVAGA